MSQSRCVWLHDLVWTHKDKTEQEKGDHSEKKINKITRKPYITLPDKCNKMQKKKRFHKTSW